MQTPQVRYTVALNVWCVVYAREGSSRAPRVVRDGRAVHWQRPGGQRVHHPSGHHVSRSRCARRLRVSCSLPSLRLARAALWGLYAYSARLRDWDSLT